MFVLIYGFFFFIVIFGLLFILWVINVIQESIIVSWYELVFNGGSVVIGYYLEMKDRNSILW